MTLRRPPAGAAPCERCARVCRPQQLVRLPLQPHSARRLFLCPACWARWLRVEERIAWSQEPQYRGRA